MNWEANNKMTYHKIFSLFNRDKQTNKLIHGDWTRYEFWYLANCQWEWTEKIDGTNIRVIYENGNIRIGGKTENAQLPAQLHTSLIDMFSGWRLEKMKDLFGDKNVTLFGEGYGPKIQNGGQYRNDQGFILFDVNVNGKWEDSLEVGSLCNRLALDVVPIIGVGTLWEAIGEVHFESVVAKRAGNSLKAEGLVVRPVRGLLDSNGERIIAKLRAKDYTA